VTSYSANYYMFAEANVQDPVGVAWSARSQYTIGNIPDGTSNTVGLVERIGYYPSHDWAPLWAHPSDHSHWGWHQWSTVYGVWGLYLPQVGYRPVEAHPYYPNSGHSTTVQVLLMDGSVRGVSAGLTQATWDGACLPADGSVPGSDW
jgi:hypothetical protein